MYRRHQLAIVIEAAALYVILLWTVVGLLDYSTWGSRIEAGVLRGHNSVDPVVRNVEFHDGLATIFGQLDGVGEGEPEGKEVEVKGCGQEYPLSFT